MIWKLILDLSTNQKSLTEFRIISMGLSQQHGKKKQEQNSNIHMLMSQDHLHATRHKKRPRCWAEYNVFNIVQVEITFTHPHILGMFKKRL